MATQQLFYEEAMPVTKERHGQRSVDTKQDYRFARQVNSVPLTGVEFPSAARDYVIVFAGQDTHMPAVLLGLQQNENLFVSKDGKWIVRYVPAFVRRYPFVFSVNEEGSTFTLCIDERFEGLNENGRGERLFNEDGERSEYLDNILRFLQDYQIQFQRTRAFCDKLKELKLLEPMQAHISLPTDSQLSLTGFQVISRDRIKALEGEKLAELAKTDELELAYLHLQSLNNFSVMADRMDGGTERNRP